jgi:NADH-quinone oxidoreductase subunit M
MLTLSLIALPFVAGVALLLLPKEAAKWAAVLAALVTLALTLWAAPMVKAGADLSFSYNWLPMLGAKFAASIDGISYILVLLTALLTPIILLTASREKSYSSRFYALLLIMQSALMGVFTATDGFLFYIFWELALIPIYFICLSWGGENRGAVTFKFFLYTMVGSLFMLVALIYLQQFTPGAHSFDIQALYEAGKQMDKSEQSWLFLAFLLAFGIKMPIFPLHTWQPDTYTTAPTAGTMLLSGIMLKMGTYGVIRWMIPMLPIGVKDWGFTVVVLSVIGIVYASLIAIAQTDFKRLIAYSSIAHVGLISAGMFSLNLEAQQGALYQMFAHGISVVGLFLVADIIERRKGTREMAQLGGIRHQDARFAWLFLLLLLGSVALPLTAGFVGEFMLFIGLFQYHHILAAVAGLTVILGAVYMLRSYQTVMLGEAPKTPFASLTSIELLLLFTLAALTILFGLFPNWLLSISEASVTNLLLRLSPAATN